MAIENVNQLKTYFNTGDKPTEQQFANLIESAMHLGGRWYDPANFLPEGISRTSATTLQRTTAFQAAINAALATGGGVEFTEEWEVNTGVLTVTDRISIEGTGWKSILSTTSNTGALLKIETATSEIKALNARTAKPVGLYNFRVYYKGTSAPDATHKGIYINDTTFGNTLSNIRRLSVDGFYAGIHMSRCWAYQISECYFSNARMYSIWNTNNYDGDGGDFWIHHNHFFAYQKQEDTVTNQPGFDFNGAHVKIDAAAGIYVHDNKFYGQFNQAVHVNLSSTAFTAAQSYKSSIGHFYNNQFDHIQGNVGWGYCYLFDSIWGRGQTGSTLEANRMDLIRIANNHINVGNLVRFQSLSGAYREVSIVNNYVTRGGNIQLSYIADLTIAGNVFNRIETLDGTTLMGPAKAIELLNGLAAITGKFHVDASNIFHNYSTAPDLPTSAKVANGAKGIGFRMVQWESLGIHSYCGMFANYFWNGSALVKDDTTYGGSAVRVVASSTQNENQAFIQLASTGASPSYFNPIHARVNTAGNGTEIGFFDATPAAKQTVTGSRGGNAALASLLTALANLGLITNSSSA
jgi:hypothetical protein